MPSQNFRKKSELIPIKEVIAHLPQFIIDVRCPHCSNRVYNVSSVKVKCGSCGKGFQTDLKHRIVDEACKSIGYLLFEQDDVSVSIIGFDKELNEVIDKLKDGLRNVIVKEVEEKKVFTNTRHCKWCGTSQVAYQCQDCGHIYEIKQEICDKCSHSFLKVDCPKCKSPHVQKYYFERYEIIDGVKVCPITRKPDIQFTKFKVKVKEISVDDIMIGKAKIFLKNGKNYNGEVMVIRKETITFKLLSGREFDCLKSEIVFFGVVEKCSKCGTLDIRGADMVTTKQFIVSKEPRHRK